MKRMPFILISIALVGFISFALHRYYSHMTPLKKTEVHKITGGTLILKKGFLDKTLRLPGELLPYVFVDLYAKVSGFIDQIPVDRGSMVKKNDLLAKLVAPDLDRTIDAAEAQYRTAKDIYERNKKTGVPIISPVAMHTSKEAAASAWNSLQSLKEQRNYLTMLAPFDGIITTRYLHPGALVIAGGGSEAVPVVRIEDTTRYRLVVFVPEAAVEGVKEGDAISFSTRAIPDRLFEAKVARIAHALDPITRTEPVELDVYNTDQNLIFASGMYIDVLWPFKGPTAGFIVPATAIVTTTYNRFVIRIKNGVTEWVDVERGNAAGGNIEIFGNLQEGDTLVVRATDELKAGVKVDVENNPV